jgi:hypothetical protein
VTYGNVVQDNKKFSGTFSAEYKIVKTEKRIIGAGFFYKKRTNDLIYYGPDEYLGQSEVGFYTLVFIMEQALVQNKKHEIYYNAGVGITLGNRKLKKYDNHNNYNINNETDLNSLFVQTSVGIKSTRNNIGSLFEIGLGGKGIFNFGLSYRFQ